MLYRIVYKSVAALLSLAMIPIAVFSPMIRLVGDISMLDYYVGEAFSLYDLYVLFFGKESTFSGFGGAMTEEVKGTMPALITSGSFLALALIVSVVTAVVAIFGRKKRSMIILSVISVLSGIGMFVSFNSFAAPYVDGTIGVSDLGIMESGLLSGIVGAIVNVKILQISTAGFLMIGCALAVLLWTLAFVLVEIGDNNSEKIKKVK